MNKVVVVVSALLILVLVNWAIYAKEQHLEHGVVVYLELAPVDPRSLMQGDYMALRFEVGQEIQQALRALQASEETRPSRLEASNGYALLQLNQNRVASFAGIQVTDEPLAENQLRLRYRVRNGRVKFATNAFFFQEGEAELYENADYGRFRVNAKGEPLLVAMHDENLNQLGVQN